MDKKLGWVQDASNYEYICLDVSPKRGFEGMEQRSVLAEFGGIAMHDCWVSCWNYPDIQHTVCCAISYVNSPGLFGNEKSQNKSTRLLPK